MRDEWVTLTAAEQKRVLVLNHLEQGAVTVAEAAPLLGVSVRPVKRLRAEYWRAGAGAQAHGNRGWRRANSVEMEAARRVVERA